MIKYRIQKSDFLFSVLFLLSSFFFFASCGSSGGGGGGSSYVTISGVVQFEDRVFDLQFFVYFSYIGVVFDSISL